MPPAWHTSATAPSCFKWQHGAAAAAGLPALVASCCWRRSAWRWRRHSSSRRTTSWHSCWACCRRHKLRRTSTCRAATCMPAATPQLRSCASTPRSRCAGSSTGLPPPVLPPVQRRLGMPRRPLAVATAAPGTPAPPLPPCASVEQPLAACQRRQRWVRAAGVGVARHPCRAVQMTVATRCVGLAQRVNTGGEGGRGRGRGVEPVAVGAAAGGAAVAVGAGRQTCLPAVQMTMGGVTHLPARMPPQRHRRYQQLRRQGRLVFWPRLSLSPPRRRQRWCCHPHPTAWRACLPVRPECQPPALPTALTACLPQVGAAVPPVAAARTAGHPPVQLPVCRPRVPAAAAPAACDDLARPC